MVIMYLAKLRCFTNLNSGSIRITILTNHHYHHSSEVTTSFHRGNSGEIPCPPCRWYINGTMRSVSTSPSMWATGTSRWPRKMPLSGFRAWDILVQNTLPGQNNQQKLLAWWNKGEFQATFGDPIILMLKFVLLSVWAIQNHPQKNRLINAVRISVAIRCYPRCCPRSPNPGSTSSAHPQVSCTSPLRKNIYQNHEFPNSVLFFSAFDFSCVTAVETTSYA